MTTASSSGTTTSTHGTDLPAPPPPRLRDDRAEDDSGCGAHRRRLPGAASLGWAIPMLGLTLVVLVMWTGVTGDRMNLGGDDSHLYYLDPWRWIRHVPLYVVDPGFGGFNPRLFLLPFVGLIGVLSWLPFNVQGLCFGLLLAATWTGVARLHAELVPGSRAWSPGGQVAASVTTLAPLVAATQWSNELYSIYWMAALPWLAVFVLRHHATGAWRWVWLTAGVSVALAPAMSAVAWSGACGIALVGIVGVGLASQGKRLRARRLGGLLAAVIGVNLFWLAPMTASAFGGQPRFAETASGEGKSDAERVVGALAAVQQPVDTIALRVSSRLLETYRAPERVPNDWSANLHLLGVMPAGLMLAGVALGGSRHRRTLVPLCLLWVVLLWLGTVSVVPGGLEAFSWLTRNVPGWAAFRNFYDKFAIPLALVTGLGAGAGFAALTSRLRPRRRNVAAGAVVVAMALYGWPLLRGDYFHLPYQGDTPTNRVSHGLPDDYLALLSAVEELPPGGVLTVPLRSPGWTMIPTSASSAYIGVSPVTLLTGRLDVNGLATAPRRQMSALAPTLRSAVERGDVAAMAALVRELGVNYVIVGPPADRRLAARERLGPSVRADEEVWSTYVQDYAPAVVSSHGRFTIRRISPRWATAPVELSAPVPTGDGPVARAGLGERRATAGCHGRLTWGQASPASYHGTLSADRGCSIVLRRAFDPRWRLEVAGRTVRPSRALGFAAQFSIPGPIADEPFTLRYEGQAMIPGSLASSGLATILLLALTLRDRRHRRAAPAAPGSA